MKRLAVWSLLSVVAFSSTAYAGFEWMPPSQQPAQQPAQQQPRADISSQYSAPAPMQQSMQGNGGYAAPSVTAEPLNSYAAPVSAPPSQPRRQAPPQTMNLSGQGLVINPYPLQDPANVAQPSYVSDDSVYQAMAEQSRALNPLRLGAGLKTGSRPAMAAAPRAPRAPDYGSAYGSDAVSGMTPMMGGEPLPLPGTATPTMATPVRQYAEAVGFGRDLPLGLALSQVVPADYSHSFAAGVDAGTSVTWEGGKPWNQALDDMLRPEGLAASINGNQVTIHPISRL